MTDKKYVDLQARKMQHVFLHFGTFGLEVFQLILASKFIELEQLKGPVRPTRPIKAH